MKIGIIKSNPVWKKADRQRTLNLIQNIDNSEFLAKVLKIKDKTKVFKCLFFISKGNYPEELKKAAQKILFDEIVQFQKASLAKNREHSIDTFGLIGINRDPNAFHIDFSNCVKKVNSFEVEVKTEQNDDTLVSTVKRKFPFLNRKFNYCQIENGEFKNYSSAAKILNFCSGVKFVKNIYKERVKNYIENSGLGIAYNAMIAIVEELAKRNMDKYR